MSEQFLHFRKKALIPLIGGILAWSSLSGCYFFREKDVINESGENSSVIGESIGVHAGEVDPLALADVHAVSSTYAPAAIRPDPDMVVRRLLLQYRSEGAIVAREIGRVEQFRLLLGGANEDFTKVPQATYDATSLLAKLKVAEEVCQGLVAPTAWQQPGWSSILPAPAVDTETNIRFLTQSILGLPDERIPVETYSSLQEILDTGMEDGAYTNNSYIPVCATLVVDAERLVL